MVMDAWRILSPQMGWSDRRTPELTKPSNKRAGLLLERSQATAARSSKSGQLMAHRLWASDDGGAVRRTPT